MSLVGLVLVGAFLSVGSDDTPTTDTTSVNQAAQPAEPSLPTAIHVPTRQQVNQLLNENEQVDSLTTSEYARLTTLSQIASAYWLTNNDEDTFRKLSGAIEDANDDEWLSVVLYYIPGIGCNFDLGAPSHADYLNWVDSVIATIGSQPTLIVIEPDALPMQECLTPEQVTNRNNTISEAVSRLQELETAQVYLDAGHSAWLPAETMATYLTKANIASADGFSLNVSNFQPDADLERYGNELSEQLDGKKYIIDTSRNGMGAPEDLNWCNPRGRGLGRTPQIIKDQGALTAYLYIKIPGESDGTCNGGPAEGSFWLDYALELVENAQL